MTLPGYVPPPDATAIALVFAKIRDLADKVEAAIDALPAPPEMQSRNNVSIPSGSGGYTLAVTFPVEFSTVPAIVATSGDASLTNPRIFSKSETGFSIRWDRGSSGSYGFDWIAMVPTPPPA